MFGLFKKKKPSGQDESRSASKSVAAEDPTHGGFPKGQPPAPSGFPQGQPPAPMGIPQGQPPGLAGSVAISSGADWRQACDTQYQEFASMAAQVVSLNAGQAAQAQVETSFIDGALLPLEQECERRETLVQNWWDRIGADRNMVELRLRQMDLELVVEKTRRQLRAQAAPSMMQCVAPGAGHTSPAARWVGEWDAFEAFSEMRKLEVQLQGAREATDLDLPILQRYHDTALQYWSTVFNTEARLFPEAQKHAAGLIKSRMDLAERILFEHQAWRTRGQS